MTVLIDRFNVLSRRIQEYVNRNRLKRKLKDVAEDFSQFALLRLRAASPDGSKWEDPPNVFALRQTFKAQRSPRPSLRQHGITLDQGWRVPKFDFRGSTRDVLRGSINIFNDAPQSEWVLEGVDKNYYIHRPNLDDKLWFYHFRKGAVSAPNFVARLNKIEPNATLNAALNQLDNEGDRLFNEEFERFVFGPLEGLDG